jgi:hypothetical protein
VLTATETDEFDALVDGPSTEMMNPTTVALGDGFPARRAVADVS